MKSTQELGTSTGKLLMHMIFGFSHPICFCRLTHTFEILESSSLTFSLTARYSVKSRPSSLFRCTLGFLRVVSHPVACEVNSDWSFSNLLDSDVFSDFRSVIVFWRDCMVFEKLTVFAQFELPSVIRLGIVSVFQYLVGKEARLSALVLIYQTRLQNESCLRCRTYRVQSNL